VRAEVRKDGVVSVDVPTGSIAYVDRDWLPDSSRSVPSITVVDGTLAWCDEAPLKAPGSLDPDTAAARVLLAVAREAAAALEGLAPASIEVTGSGLIARNVRAIVGDTAAVGGGHRRPEAIIDVTGDPSVIGDSTRRLADLGTLVLVGEALGRRTELNLYPDVHVRGLTLVGVAPPLEGTTSGFALPDTFDPLVEQSRELLVRVPSGAPLPPGAAWYRLSS
jgi:hypothetical protein